MPAKLTGKSGSVQVRLVPAPRGSGIIAAAVPKKLLTMAGISDVYTSSCGKSRTLGNFVKATFIAIRASYNYLTPSLWQHVPLYRGVRVSASVSVCDR